MWTETKDFFSQSGDRHGSAGADKMDVPPYKDISTLLMQGQVVPFLGAGVNLGNRPPDTPWRDDAAFLPNGAELARFLAKTVEFPSQDDHDLADLSKVASHLVLTTTRAQLRESLHRILDHDFPPCDMHRYLADVALTRPLLIVTTNYDDLLERAFRMAGCPYDLVVYPTDHSEVEGSALWWQHGAKDPKAVSPNELYIDLSQTSVIYKMHGAIDRLLSAWDSYVITEEDYVDFLARMTTQTAVPSLVMSHLRTRNLLFLGYGLRDWNLRVVLKNLKGHEPLYAPVPGEVRLEGNELKSWSIQFKPSELEVQLWNARGVHVYDVDINEFAKCLHSESTRTTEAAPSTIVRPEVHGLPLPKDYCPYRGLESFTEADAAYFFGRERYRDIVTANLLSARLTILLGQSGVGKSSLLMAGVIPALQQSRSAAVVMWRAWQDPDVLAALKARVLDVVRVTAGREIQVDTGLPLDVFLFECGNALRGPIYLIFDQFEEFFLYHSAFADKVEFDAEFARSVNRDDVNVNFLLSLREEGLSHLDRFKIQIPNVLSNRLRLFHLDQQAAIRAIRSPLDEYNRHLPEGDSPITAEIGLGDTIVDQVQTGKVAWGIGGRGLAAKSAAETEGVPRVDTPFLQMVMTRVWEEERRAKSCVLRLATLQRLGGSERIIRTHLDQTLNRLNGQEKMLAAKAFRYLVTPSGTKAAYSVADLADFARVPERRLSPVLMKLSSRTARILRAVEPTTREAEDLHYEIYHDVLAPAVLDWRQHYLEQIRTVRQRIITVGLGAVILLLVGILYATAPKPLSELPSIETGQIVFLGSPVGDKVPKLYQYGLRSSQAIRIPLDADILFQNSFFNAPALSHDGQRIAFVGLLPTTGFRILTMPVDGSSLDLLGSAGSWIDIGPAWSPDDRKLAFASTRDGGPPQIYLMNADGTAPRKLTNSKTEAINPTWSPDGTQIAFAMASERCGCIHSIYSLNVANPSEVRQLLNDPITDDTDPVWSPKGNLMAYTHKGEERYVIQVVDLSSHITTSLPCPENRSCWAPTWSPDGRYVAFVATTGPSDQNGSIYYTEASGHFVANLLDSGYSANIFRASWGP